MNKLLKVVAIIVLILGIVSSIGAGTVYPLTDVSNMGKIAQSYNWYLLLVGSVISLVIFSILLVLGKYYQLLQENNIYARRSYEYAMKANNPADAQLVYCKKCGSHNPGWRVVCEQCGSRIVR